MTSIDFEVKGQNALELSQYLENPLSYLKVKGQGSSKCEHMKIFSTHKHLRIYIKLCILPHFNSEGVEFQVLLIFSSQNLPMTRKIFCAKYLWDHLLFCLVPCEEVDSFQHCFLGEGWGVGGYVFLEYFLFFIVSHIIFWFQKYH